MPAINSLVCQQAVPNTNWPEALGENLKLTEGINLGLAVLLCIDDYPGLCHTDWSKPIGYNWCSRTHLCKNRKKLWDNNTSPKFACQQEHCSGVCLNSSLSAVQTIKPSVFCMFNCPNSHCNKISHAGYPKWPSIYSLLYVYTHLSLLVCLFCQSL